MIASSRRLGKAVSPPASLADATYFCGDKSRQNRLCREGARQTAPGSLRCSVQAGRAELAPFGRSDMRRLFFRLALCFLAPSRQMGGSERWVHVEIDLRT